MIELKNLQKTIDQLTVIDIEHLAVQPGEIAAVIGPVDSGKETLLELLTGRMRPTMGTVTLSGIDPFIRKDDFSKLTGILFAEENLYKRQSTLSNLQFFARLYRLPKARVQEVLAEVGLVDEAVTRVEDLNSSMIKRLALGRAILHKPAVLILVDLFDRCDESSAAIIKSLIRSKAENGAAVLLISEDDAQLNDLCTVIHKIDKGRIIETYLPEETSTPSLPFMIPAKLEDSVALVNPADILYAFAQDDKTFLQTAEDCFPTQYTLSELEKRLSRSGFFRAHRGYLVNLQHVKEVIPFTRDSFSLKLKDEKGTLIPLSKSSARELRDLLGY
jgi:ABC-2 type transport system ATP-binding protein